jgi:hypothetical protein
MSLEFALVRATPLGVATCQVNDRPPKLSAKPFPLTTPGLGSCVKR